ncbi:MAG: YkgJ family cysteine cluster protein, partial [Spirochaetaceae bacterium]|nr:YkgJ family cysteine cluster protein [Spirochaetaceae bacterium]
MSEIQRLKEEILKEYPRLDRDAEFSFGCHPGVKCFNGCCADVNIFLTPYDIVRLKKRLGITSEEFLKKYTIMPFDKNLPYPVVMFRMSDDDKKACQLVGDKGCTVYEDRPWACRMYPLGLASPGETGESTDKDFYFLMRDPICEGFKESNKWTVDSWMRNQGVDEYDAMGREFKDITLHPFFREGQGITPKQVEMFFMACYNVDKFRDFVFNSSFLRKFIVDQTEQDRIKADDVALLRFGFRWIRFAIFGEDTMKIKDEIAEDKEK